MNGRQKTERGGVKLSAGGKIERGGQHRVRGLKQRARVTLTLFRWNTFIRSKHSFALKRAPFNSLYFSINLLLLKGIGFACIHYNIIHVCKFEAFCDVDAVHIVRQTDPLELHDELAAGELERPLRTEREYGTRLD